MHAPTTSGDRQLSLPEMQSLENQDVSPPPPDRSFLTRLLGRLISHISIDLKSIQAVQRAAQARTVVYVMPSASIFDHLLLRTLTVRNHLPEPQFANGVPHLLCRPPRENSPFSWMWIKSRFRKPSLRAREECREAVETLAAKRPIQLFLNQPGFFHRPLRWHVLVWEELIRAERKGKINIALVPVNFIWGRRPDRLKRSIVDILFGDTSAPGYLRKSLVVLRHIHDVSVKMGEPTELSRFLTTVQASNDEQFAKKLRRLLSSYLFRERKLMIGPPLHSRDRIIRTFFRDPDLRQLVESVARREKKSEAEIWKRANKLLRAMISDYDQTMVAICYRVFRWIWNRLYEKLEIEPNGLERLKRVARNYPVVLVPSHKSHVDYLLLSAVFYENDLRTPHVASGDNLTFWPMGAIFRKNGAFFIRRTIGGDLLYARLLGLYVRWLIRAGYTQEFFIEGGRSRTGKLIFPKHGLLAMQVDAYLSGANRDLYVVPISITYDQVLEEGSYRAELSGKEKERESFWALVRSRRFLGRRHGSVYVRFSEPISLRKYFDVNGEEPIPLKIRKTRTLALAADIVRAIASETTVTASSLGACSILAQAERAILKSTLNERMKWLSEYVMSHQIPCSKEIQVLDAALSEVMAFFSVNRWITMETGRDDVVLNVRADKRLTLDYYKNQVLHYFLPPGMAALVMEQEEFEKTAAGDMAFLRDIFAHEFVLRDDEDVGFFLEQGRPTLEGSENRLRRRFFAGLLKNYLESYDLTARAVMLGIVKGLPTRENIREVLTFGNHLYATGNITRIEAVSSANVRSASEFIYERRLFGDRAALASWHKQLVRLAHK
ncbi:MAG TPA: 1-acyl-sn-glycerol-3-phosphate acyltransferase [Bdellovibrionota bacterium]|nr:1-acyl-sn-glycerol-3-phosphate acyltransferase [Bdellovibrionota bacterium]